VHHSRRFDPVRDIAAGTWPPRCTVVRAAVDAASWERNSRHATGLVLAVVQQRLAAATDIVAALDRAGPVRHAALLRAVLDEAGGGSDSRAEVDVLRILRDLGVTDVRRQVEIETPDGTRRVDLVVRLPDGRLLAIEVDGPHHDDPEQREADAAKDAALIAAGYQVLHIPVSLLRRRPTGVRAQLAAILAAARCDV
jgi:very-short-patch-repair endonuclease